MRGSGRAAGGRAQNEFRDQRREAERADGGAASRADGDTGGVGSQIVQMNNHN